MADVLEGLTPQDEQMILLSQIGEDSGDPDIVNSLLEFKKRMADSPGDPVDVLRQIREEGIKNRTPVGDAIVGGAEATKRFVTERIPKAAGDAVTAIKGIVTNSPDVISQTIELTKQRMKNTSAGGEAKILGDAFLEVVKEKLPEDFNRSAFLSRAGGAAIGAALATLIPVPGSTLVGGAAGSVLGGQLNQALGNEEDTPLLKPSFPYVSDEAQEEFGSALAGEVVGAGIAKGVGASAKVTGERRMTQALTPRGSSLELLVNAVPKTERDFLRAGLSKGAKTFDDTNILNKFDSIDEMHVATEEAINSARQAKETLVTDSTNKLKGKPVLGPDYTNKVLANLDARIARISKDALDKEAVGALTEIRENFAKTFGVDQPGVASKVLGPDGKTVSTPVSFSGKDFAEAQQYLNTIYEHERFLGVFDKRVIAGAESPSQFQARVKVQEALQEMAEITRESIQSGSLKAAEEIGDQTLVNSLNEIAKANNTIHNLIPYENVLAKNSEAFQQRLSSIITGGGSPEAIAANLGFGLRMSGLNAVIPNFLSNFSKSARIGDVLSSKAATVKALREANLISKGQLVPKGAGGTLKSLFGKTASTIDPVKETFAPALGALEAVESLSRGYPAEVKGYTTFNPLNGTITNQDEAFNYLASLNGQLLRRDIGISEFRIRVKNLRQRGRVMKFGEVEAMLGGSGREQKQVIDEGTSKKLTIKDPRGEDSVVAIPKTEEEVAEGGGDKGAALLKRAGRLSSGK